MLSRTLECKFSDLQQTVLPRLRGRVFHLAPGPSIERFQRAGIIPAAEAGYSGSVLWPSGASYGMKRGYVCLFDFRNTGQNPLEDAFVRHYFLKPYHYSLSYGYLFLEPDALPGLINWKRACRDVGTRELYVPFVESWYPGNLPLDLITECLMVSVQPTSRTVREILAKATR